MAITGQTGLQAEYSSVPDRGITDTGVGVDGARVGVVATMAAEVGATVAALLAGADLHVVRLAASTVQLVVDFTAALRPTVAEASTVVAAVASTAAADTAVVGTGNRGVIRVL